MIKCIYKERCNSMLKQLDEYFKNEDNYNTVFEKVCAIIFTPIIIIIGIGFILSMIH